ncbi:MAG: hypothetical protein IJI03_20895 [Rudaea sp.]|nr:hypothetical protein [Rudaea sp.]
MKTPTWHPAHKAGKPFTKWSFAAATLLGCVSQAYAQNAMTGAITSSTPGVQTSITTTSAQGNVTPAGIPYTVNFGQGNDIKLTGFTAAGSAWTLSAPYSNVVISRADPTNPPTNQTFSTRLELWEQTTSVTSNTINVGPSQYTSFEAVLLAGLINVGSDNTFNNSTTPNNNNIERIDFFIAPYTAQSARLTIDGFPVIDRGTGDSSKIAALLGSGGSCSVTTYGPLQSLSNWGTLSATIPGAYYLFQMDTTDANLRPVTPQSQGIAGTLFTFANLGIAAGQTVCGFSLFANDVTGSGTQVLTDPTTFPRTTDGGANGGLDVVSGGGLWVAPPVMRLTKAIVNRVANSDQFTVQIKNGATVLAPATGSVTTTSGTGSTVTANTGTTGFISTAAGTLYTITETASGTTTLGNYVQSISCTRNGIAFTPGGSPNAWTVTPNAGDAIDCVLTNANKPIVTTTKNASANPLVVGATGQTYSIVVTIAQGPTTAPITISDVLPTGITLSGTPTVTGAGATLSNCPSSGGNLTGCTLSTNLGNGTYTITVPINVALNAVGASGGTNTVNLSGGGDTSCTSATGEACDASTTTTAVSTPPNVTMSKAFNPNPIASGGTSTLTITIANTQAGAIALTGIAFTDTFPTGMTVASTPASAQCSGSVAATNGNPGSVSLSGGSLAAGATCQIQVAVTAP